MKKGSLNRSIIRFISWNLKHWWLAIGCSVALSITGLFFGKNISLDANLESLLPKSADIVKQLKIVQKKSGASYDLKLVLWGGPIEDRVKAAAAFDEYIRKQPDLTRSVRYRTPKTFFEKHKYLLVPLDSLKALLSKIQDEQKKIPGFRDPLGLEEEESAAKPEMSEGEKKRELDDARDLLKRLNDMPMYLQSPDDKVISIRMVPNLATLNVENNRKVIHSFEQVIAKFDFKRFNPDMKTALYGSITDHVQQYEGILEDVSFGGWGILLILIVVALFFRSGWSLLTTVPPLITGLSIGLGLISFLERSLNTIAVFLVLVVFGVGIEFGVHLWARMVQERQHKNLADSLLTTWLTTGKATLTSSTALLCGFALLTLSSFQGFAQFGRVAIVLVMSTAGCFFLFMPAWIILTEKLRGQQTWKPTLAEMIIFQTSGGNFWWPEPFLKLIRWCSLGLTLAGLVICAMWLRFDYQFEEGFRNLGKDPIREALESINSDRFRPSAVAVVRSDKQAGRFVEHFRKNRDRFPEIALVTGLSMFLPTDQPERLGKLKEIADEIKPKWIKLNKDPEIRKALLEIKDTAYTIKPVKFDEVPPELRDTFLATDGSGDSLVFLYNINGPTDGRRAIRFSNAIERLRNEFSEPIIISGNEMIFADVVRRVIAEGPWFVLGMFFLVFLICWIDFRSFRHSMVTMAPVVSGFILTGSYLVIAGTKINFYNMVALASLGAMVVDNSIHMYHRFLEMRDSGEERPDLMSLISVGPTVLTCTLTSIFGYGGMVLANHRGVFSLGLVAIMGLFLCFVSAAIFLPPWLNLLVEKKRPEDLRKLA